MTKHKVGTREDWLAARAQLLIREKEHTRLGDDIARQRRELPWVPLEKEYRFDTPRLNAASIENRRRFLVSPKNPVRPIGRRPLLSLSPVLPPRGSAGTRRCVRRAGVASVRS